MLRYTVPTSAYTRKLSVWGAGKGNEPLADQTRLTQAREFAPLLTDVTNHQSSLGRALGRLEGCGDHCRRCGVSASRLLTLLSLLSLLTHLILLILLTHLTLLTLSVVLRRRPRMRICANNGN